MRWAWLSSILACMAFLAAPARADDSGQLPQRLQSVIGAYLASRRDAEKISGAALRVDLKGHPSVDVYAGTDGRSGRPIDASTLFQIGSNTKHFTAALMLKLEAEGLLNIDQTIGQWLPQYPAWANVTIRSLLNMTSPIPNYSETLLIAQTMAADMHHQFSMPSLVAAVYGRDLPTPNGWFYSNTNSILAGLIIEAATHMSYRDALEAKLLRPLHLEDTFYEDGPYPPRVLDHLPVGIYDNNDCTLYQPKPCERTAWAPLVGRDVSHMNMSWAGPAGGIISTTRDLDTWIRALFGGRVLPKRELDEMTAIVSEKTGRPLSDVSADEPVGFALDLARSYRPELGGTFWWYEGMTFGFRVIFAYWPQYDLVMTAATNSQPADGEDRLAPDVIGGAFETLKADGLLPPQ